MEAIIISLVYEAVIWTAYVIVNMFPMQNIILFVNYMCI